NGERNKNRDALRAEMSAKLVGVDGHALCKRLLEAGVPAGPVQTIDQVFDHPHTRHRDMAVEIGNYRGTGIPVKLSRTPGTVRTLPPHFGEHTRALLDEHGYSSHEIEDLLD